QAALRGCWRRGHGQRNSCFPCRAGYPLSTSRATKWSWAFVLSALTKNKVQSTKYKDPRPQAQDHLLIPHRDLSLKSDRFLIVWIDPDRAQRILPRLTPVAAIEKDPAQQDVRVNQFWIPEDRRLERRNRRLLIAATKIDAATQQIRLGVSRLDHDDAMQLRKRLVIAPGLIKIARLDQQILRG